MCCDDHASYNCIPIITPHLLFNIKYSNSEVLGQSVSTSALMQAIVDAYPSTLYMALYTCIYAYVCVVIDWNQIMNSVIGD